MERPCRNDRDCLAICDGASLGCQPREANSDGLLGQQRARPEGRKAGLHTRGGAGCGARPACGQPVRGRCGGCARRVEPAPPGSAKPGRKCSYEIWVGCQWRLRQRYREPTGSRKSNFTGD